MNRKREILTQSFSVKTSTIKEIVVLLQGMVMGPGVPRPTPAMQVVNKLQDIDHLRGKNPVTYNKSIPPFPHVWPPPSKSAFVCTHALLNVYITIKNEAYTCTSEQTWTC